MNNLHIGQIITTPQPPRDAVHMAIARIVAGETLHPGEHVGIHDGKGLRGREKLKCVGVVDPFLVVNVERGQTFWLFLYPGSITSLRHEWEHPAFAVSESEAFLRRYAVEHNPYIADPNEAYAHLIEGLKRKEVFYNGNDLHGSYELEDAEGLKEHAEKVLGIEIDWENFTFSCTC